MNLGKIANPYTVFAFAWAMSLLLYAFGWAGIFPKISTALFIFLLALIVIFAATGLFFNQIKSRINIDGDKPVSINSNILLAINTLMWIANFAYSGIPLLSGTRNDEFGVPTLIVVAVSFNSFFAIYCYYLFLKTRKKTYLLIILYCIIIFALFYSRGYIVMTMCSMFFLWINVKKPKLNFKKFAGIFVSILLLLYLFGVAGNYRSINDIASYKPDFDPSYNSNLIMQYGDASASFKNSFVPDEYFWGYIYISSPLANLQYNINNQAPPISLNSAAGLFTNEILLDAVGKRVDMLLNIQPKKPELIVEQLTVCTTLAGSYLYAGWWGMVLFIIVFYLVPLAYILFIMNNPLGVIGISIMCTIFLFSMFDNMLIQSGLTVQLFYPIAFILFSRVKFAPKAIAG